MSIQPSRRYRCSYHPKDTQGFPTLADTGVLPFVQLRANTAEEAQRKAHARTGCAIAQVERIEVAA